MNEKTICIDELMDELSEYDMSAMAQLDDLGLSITDEDGNDVGFIPFY